MYFINDKAFAFRVNGEDSKRYINARITNEINLLDEKQSISAGILDAKAKTQGYFEIFKQDDEYLFISEGGEVETVVKAFKQFIVADRVTVNLEKIKLFNVINASKNLTNFSLSYKVNDITTFVLLDDKDSKDFLKELSEFNHFELSKEEYNFKRMENNKLSFEEELESIFFPEAELVKSYSTNKGCYTGQEAVEMVLARGKLPAILKYCILERKVEINKKTKVFEDKECSTEIGSVLNIAYSNEEKKTALLLRLRKTPNEVFIEKDQEPISIM